MALAVELQVFHRPTQPAQRSDDLIRPTLERPCDSAVTAG